MFDRGLEKFRGGEKKKKKGGKKKKKRGRKKMVVLTKYCEIENSRVS